MNRKADAPPAWPLRGSEYFEIQSAAVGDTMAVGVWKSPEHIRAVPNATGSPTKPQLVYVLDASVALALAASVGVLQSADLVRPGFPRLLFVGLDYPEGRRNARIRDYVPPGAVTESMMKKYEGQPPEYVPGGADNFLEFLETELDPWIRERYAVEEAPAGLLGDSWGGTFVAHCLIRRSTLFNRYWLGSPGLFDTPADLTGRLLNALAEERSGAKKIYLTLGELEATGGGVDYYEEPGASFSRVVAGLQALRPGAVDWQHRIYPGHTHASVFLPALNDALQFLYGKR
jgi:predicted alpha/beta superfamily hydrolase